MLIGADTVASTTATTTAGTVVQSIRDQIPDPVSNPASDGTAFSFQTLLRWTNDAMRIMASTAPIVQDWHAIQSSTGMDVYEIPSTTLSVEQLWYDLWPCYRSPEYSALFVSKITSRSYFFGPHAVHSTPRLHVWPACDRTGATTTLNGAIGATDTSIVLTSATNFKAFGFFDIEGEIILYRTITTNTVTNVLRGQAGTAAVAHGNLAAVTERNIFFKMSRLPTALTAVGDVLEIPVGLTPCLELYVLSKVREAEQDTQAAKSLRQEFQALMKDLEARAPIPGLRQGMQVRTSLAAPLLFGGRVYVPAIIGFLTALVGAIGA